MCCRDQDQPNKNMLRLSIVNLLEQRSQPPSFAFWQRRQEGRGGESFINGEKGRLQVWADCWCGEAVGGLAMQSATVHI